MWKVGPDVEDSARDHDPVGAALSNRPQSTLRLRRRTAEQGWGGFEHDPMTIKLPLATL